MRNWLNWLKKILIFITMIGLSACTLRNPDKDFIYITSRAYGHYGGNIGIPNYYVDGVRLGNLLGWGGGGSINCCVKVPKNPREIFYLQVEWETCDIGHIKFVDNKIVDKTQQCIIEYHKEKVLVNFAVSPGNSSGIFFHFLPGNKVEAWVSKYPPGSNLYNGPIPPVGVGPLYNTEVKRIK